MSLDSDDIWGPMGVARHEGRIGPMLMPREPMDSRMSTCLDFDAANLESRFRASYADEVALWLSFFRYPDRVEVMGVRVVER